MKVNLVKENIPHKVSKLALASLGVGTLRKAQPNSDVFIKARRLASSEEVKQSVISALAAKTPVERAIVLDNKTSEVLQDKMGTEVSCLIDVKKLCKGNSGDMTLFHGHPKMLCEDGRYYSAPISLDDFRVLNDSPINEIVAYDEHGLESRLAKGNSFKKIKSSKVKEIETGLFQTLFATLDQENIEKIKATSDAELAFRLVTEQQKKRCGMQAVDNYWRNNAENYGLKYVSEFHYD